MSPPPPKQRLFIFHGDDFSEAEDHLKATIAKYDPHNSAIQFYGEEDAIETIIETLSTPPMFTRYTFAIFYHYAKIAQKKHLTTLVEELHPQNFLYLVKEEKTFHSTSFENKLRQLPYVQVKLNFFLNETALRTRIKKTFQKNNLALPPDVLDHISQHLIPTPQLLKSELDKLTTYFANRTTPIQIAELSDILAFENTYSSYDVIDAIFSPQRHTMLRRFLIFLRHEGNLNELILFLSKEVSRLIQYHEEKKQGTQEATIFKHMRLFYKKHQQALRRRAHYFSLAKLEKLLVSLLEIDATLKSETFTPTAHTPFAKANPKAKCLLERALLNFN